MTEVEKLYDPLIGQKVGNGQCGALTSDYMRVMTNCKYQWAGEAGNGQLPPNCNPNSAWDVYTTADWQAIGFETINNPTLKQLKGSDTFYIAPRPGLPTGHTGLVASIIKGNVITFEQNVCGAKYVQKLSGVNSWDWYDGFDGIVRKKAVRQSHINETNKNEGDIDMYLIQIVDKTGKHKGKWFISNGTHCRYIHTPRMLANYQNQYGKLNLRIDKMYSSELFKEFGGEKNIL